MERGGTHVILGKKISIDQGYQVVRFFPQFRFYFYSCCLNEEDVNTEVYTSVANITIKSRRQLNWQFFHFEKIAMFSKKSQSDAKKSSSCATANF